MTHGAAFPERNRQVRDIRANYEGDGSVFTFAISGPNGMQSTTIDDNTVMRVWNPDNVQEKGYHRETKIYDGHIKNGVILGNHLGGIWIEVHWHGIEKPSTVRCNPKTGKFSIDDAKIGDYDLNGPTLAARRYAQDHVPDMQATFHLIDGQTHLLEPTTLPLATKPIRVPKPEEIKTTGRGRPPRPRAPPAAITIPTTQQGTGIRRDVAGIYRAHDSRGRVKYSIEMPLSALEKYLPSPKSDAPSDASPATFLDISERDDALWDAMSSGSATIPDIISIWSKGKVGEDHALAEVCHNHVRQTIRRVNEKGLTVDGVTYTIQAAPRDPGTFPAHAMRSGRLLTRYILVPHGQQEAA